MLADVAAIASTGTVHAAGLHLYDCPFCGAVTGSKLHTSDICVEAVELFHDAWLATARELKSVPVPFSPTSAGVWSKPETKVPYRNSIWLVVSYKRILKLITSS